MMSGCASVSPTQVGQTAGSIAGGAIAPGVGMPVGALIGMLAGLIIERHIDQAREEKERVVLNERLQSPGGVWAQPVSSSQTIGEPTRVWIDERLNDGRLIAGHFDTQDLP